MGRQFFLVFLWLLLRSGGEVLQDVGNLMVTVAQMQLAQTELYKRPAAANKVPIFVCVRRPTSKRPGGYTTMQ